MRDTTSRPPRPVLDVMLDLVLKAPILLDNGHTRETIRNWLYDEMDKVAGGPPLTELEPTPGVVVLPAGTKRRLYVNRDKAAGLKPPIMVEEDTPGNGRTIWYARNVKGHGVEFEFKWTERNDVAPSLWIETEDRLELTL